MIFSYNLWTPLFSKKWTQFLSAPQLHTPFKKGSYFLQSWSLFVKNLHNIWYWKIKCLKITVTPYPSVLDFWKIKLEKSWRTEFLVYFELDFYCLCSLQKSILKLILKSSSSNLIFQTWFVKKYRWIGRFSHEYLASHIWCSSWLLVFSSGIFFLARS